MEMPAELLEGFDRLHQEGQAEESSQEGQYASTLEKTNRKMEALNRNWGEIEKSAISFMDALKAEIETGGRPDLDSAVLFIKDQERRFRIAFSPRLQVQKQMQRAFFSLPQSVRVRAVASNRREIATYTRLLEGIRGLGLRLTELQALVEPSGDAPTVSDVGAAE
jgi:predicted transcriptional regulator